MGIRGLTGWIQWIAPSAADTFIDWKELEGKRVGVDILGFLYKAKTHRMCVFETLARLVDAFHRYRIEPIVVFDGKPPDAKKATLQQRSFAFQRGIEETRIFTDKVHPAPTTFTSGERDLCKQLLYACGVLCLNASGEADDLLAYLSRRGELDAVFSNDLDLLSRGVEHLYVPPSRMAGCVPGDKSGWTHYTLSSILYESQLSYEDFLDLCVIMGSDYTTGMPSLPYKQAYESVKYIHNLSSTLRRMKVMATQAQTLYYDAKARLRGDFATRSALMGEKQWEKWDIGAPCKEPEALASFRTTLLATLDDDIYESLLYTSTQGSGGDQYRSSCATICTHNHPESSDSQDEQDEKQYSGEQDVREDAIDNMRYDGIQDRLNT